MQPDTKNTTRALILAVQPQLQTDAEHDASCRELLALAETLGWSVLDTWSQRRTIASLDTYVGSGMLSELADHMGGPGVQSMFGAPEFIRTRPAPVDLVIVNDALSPKLQRTLERALGVEVMDRSGVILEIFERRARTRQARLEVEIARLRYELPRLRDDTTKRGREGGGGRGERGDRLVALGKQRIRARIRAMETELEGLRLARQMRKRARREVFGVALVGYTNAGKSSLMRGLTGNDVLIEDKLFATLGTTARRLAPASTPPIVVSDTVGFIQDLPHELVASFRSTLEEAADADLVLLVLDASDPAWETHLEVTAETLGELGLDETRVRVVFNKCDRVSAADRRLLQWSQPRAIQTSAHDGALLEVLRQTILEVQACGMTEELVGVPHREADLRAELYANARVLEERHNAWGTVFRVRAETPALERWHGCLIKTRLQDPIELLWNHGFELDADAEGWVDADGARWTLEVLRRRTVREGARRAERATRWLKGKLPVSVPTRTLLTSGHRVGREASGECASEMTEALLADLAPTLTAMWALPAQDASEAGLPVASMEDVRAQRAADLEAVTRQLDVPAAWLDLWRTWLEVDYGWPRVSVLCHGAIGPEACRVDARGKLRALDGWESAEVTDPSRELLALIDGSGRETSQVLDALEAAGLRLWPGVASHLVRVRAFEAVTEAAALLATGEKGASRQAQAALDAQLGVAQHHQRAQ